MELNPLHTEALRIRRQQCLNWAKSLTSDLRRELISRIMQEPQLMLQDLPPGLPDEIRSNRTAILGLLLHQSNVSTVDSQGERDIRDEIEMELTSRNGDLEAFRELKWLLPEDVVKG